VEVLGTVRRELFLALKTVYLRGCVFLCAQCWRGTKWVGVGRVPYWKQSKELVVNPGQGLIHP
jgi:hypothetical protein